MNIKKLQIWGIVFSFEDFSSDELIGVFKEFAGSIEDAIENAPVAHSFVSLKDDASLPRKGFVDTPRHKGGSAANKYLTDGSLFNPEVQNRSLAHIPGRSMGWLYFLDGCSCYSTEEITLIQGKSGRYVLADLVENYILCRCKNWGWVQCHAAAWVGADDTVSVVAGNSGYGKTTSLLAAIKNGSKFLSNDRVFLRLQDGKLEARGYPLAMNVGCGTIRHLQLGLPNFGLPDNSKIRLTPEEVVEHFHPNYDTWHPVSSINGKSFDDFLSNCFLIQEDDTHPMWNLAWRCHADSQTWTSIVSEALILFNSKPAVLEKIGVNA